MRGGDEGIIRWFFPILEDYNGLIAQLFGIDPYSRVCLTYGILNLGHPWLDSTALEYGRRVVYRSWGHVI